MRTHERRDSFIKIICHSGMLTGRAVSSRGIPREGSLMLAGSREASSNLALRFIPIHLVRLFRKHDLRQKRILTMLLRSFRSKRMPIDQGELFP
jgi:hypothetical protein